MCLGLEHGVNRLSEYSDFWPSKFTAESVRIMDVCGAHLIALEHVGSTSVPGLVAKPIIDIVAGVAALDVAEKIVPGMRSIGYDYPGDIGIPDHRIFGRDPGFRRFLIHVVVHDGDRWNDYIDFRDRLRADDVLAAEYGKLKSALVEKQPEGRAAYSELKSGFVNGVLSRLA